LFHSIQIKRYQAAHPHLPLSQEAATAIAAAVAAAAARAATRAAPAAAATATTMEKTLATAQGESMWAEESVFTTAVVPA